MQRGVINLSQQWHLLTHAAVLEMLTKARSFLPCKNRGSKSINKWPWKKLWNKVSLLEAQGQDELPKWITKITNELLTKVGRLLKARTISKRHRLHGIPKCIMPIFQEANLLTKSNAKKEEIRKIWGNHLFLHQLLTSPTQGMATKFTRDNQHKSVLNQFKIQLKS